MCTQTFIRRLKGVLATVACGVVMSSCGQIASNGTGPTFLIMQRLASAAGDQSLNSDVLPVGGVAVNDVGQATIRAAMKNAISATAPSALNDVTITSYRVRYRRTDGQNREGIDVPYGFDGASTATISVGGTATVSFDLVRRQAKLEAPLRNLAGGGGLIIISTIAEVTFYGRDQAGNEVSVMGSMDVRFGDF